ncbi:hypothetical protein [Paenibacillus lignilyticus]|uniref:Uncharacterized protein n=1 Tax=Paenibacillus lignilyticus TaxID=1172615 RepID=A0ABS5CNB2_9BACL|nr:hypothetical protein [Paenibacillus lignilyticus]MBP3967330.1 hypothetical protein [Paenibacillus lignilyticus]
MKSVGSEEIQFIIQLNDKIMPINRGLVYEDPLDEYLRANSLGEITGGGTMQEETGEIEYCDIEVLISKRNYKQISSEIMDFLEVLEGLGHILIATWRYYPSFLMGSFGTRTA